MLTLIVCWLTLFGAFGLIGRLVFKKSDWFQSFWLGCALVFVFLQIWSIFLPINHITLIVVLLVSACGLFVGWKNSALSFDAKFILTALLVVGVLAYFASRPVGLDDTLLYHLNAVKWAGEYKIVPGLGNLHTRLGFNSSFFLYAALLDNWIMQDRSSHLALFSLAATLSLEILWVLVKSKARTVKIVSLLCVPLMVQSIAKDGLLSSLSPDFAATIFAIVLAIEFLKSGRGSMWIVYLLGLLMVTVKLNTLVFASIFLVLSAFNLVKMHKINSMLLSGLAMLVIFPYLIRNYFLTGWLVYPLPIFGIHVDWLVPRETVLALHTVITTWAKHPGSEWSLFIGASFWEWFPGWFGSNKYEPEIIVFFLTVLLLITSLVMGAMNKTVLKTNGRLVYLGLISFVSIVYVFSSAPDIRFASVFVWLFFASGVTLYLKTFDWTQNLKKLVCVVVLIVSFAVGWPITLDSEVILRSVRWEKAWPTVNSSGILKPTEDDLCGNSALPCSPESNNIKLRSNKDMAKGFASNE